MLLRVDEPAVVPVAECGGGLVRLLDVRGRACGRSQADAGEDAAAGQRARDEDAS
jgi:hypothetical protein